MSYLTRNVSDIAATVPGATPVFRRYGIDFCCGGGTTLAAAAQAHDVDPGVLAEALAASGETALEVLPDMPTPALITLILERFHAGHRRDLDELRRLAQRVETVHAGHPDRPEGLSALLTEIAAELESHMAKEEAVLFPMMLAGRTGLRQGPLLVMEAEHNAFGNQLRALEAMQGAMRAPLDACGTWRALDRLLAHFVDEAYRHIHLENNVLFPRFA